MHKEERKNSTLLHDDIFETSILSYANKHYSDIIIFILIIISFSFLKSMRCIIYVTAFLTAGLDTLC